jgi:periplasmic divalent cation tolerance protein
MSILYLTCAGNQEADKIIKALLNKKLIACAKKSSISSSYLWKGKTESSEEILVLMESVEENFDKVNEEVKKLHSYETFVLYSVPVKTTPEVEKWIKEEME